MGEPAGEPDEERSARTTSARRIPEDAMHSDATSGPRAMKQAASAALQGLYARAVGREAAEPRGDGKPDRSTFSTENLVKFVIIAGQLALLVRVIGGFHIESEAYLDVAQLTLAGFVVHHFTPAAYRLPLFVLLSLGAIWIVFGFGNALWLVGIGLGLIGACHVPGPFRVRVCLLLGLAGVLVLLRGEWLPGPVPAAVWPILGSMFMFRLIVYMYDLRHDPGPVSVSRTLAYFFMLPNACFPLFPVVDYKTFRRTYYDDDPFHIYQRGVDWMVRGVVHLLLYRLVYYDLSIPTSEVSSPAAFARWALTGFLLYLRVSGQFHLIVGTLHLFGFHLPETHRRYLLASSFTDFWRRINIYWKDFMLKVFFYPVHFRLRRWGATKALVVSTLLVFAATWFFHAYQWFWLRGSFLLTGPDVLFWAILGSLVVGNALYESKHGRDRSLGLRLGNLRGLAVRASTVAGTFATICVLWSLWTSESLDEWLSCCAAAFRDWKTVAVLFSSFAVVGAAVAAGSQPPGPQRSPSRLRPRRETLLRRALGTSLMITFLYAMGTPAVYSYLGSTAAGIVQSASQRQLNRRDAALLHRGYYESLISVDRFNSQLWEVYAKKPVDWVPFKDTEAVRSTGDFLGIELLPSTSIMHRGAVLTTNRWAMRDRDYEQMLTPSAYRIALLGSSHVMGVGVSNDETFEALVETQLNRDNQSRYSRYELLNFAVASHTAPQHLMTLERKVLQFSPRAVLYFGHSHDANKATSHVADALAKGVTVPYDPLTMAGKVRVEPGTAPMLAEQQLRPFEKDALSWVYRRIVDVCKEHGIMPVWVFVPLVGEDTNTPEVDALHRMAEEAGFVTWSLRDIYEPFEKAEICLAEWDEHPNRKGHELIAAGLYRLLLESSDALGLGLSPAPPSTGLTSGISRHRQTGARRNVG